MKISIVTISFNQAEYIERTIKSVIEQDYENKEYIIVDPGSTDGSREIIEKYRNHIDTIIFEKDNGPADGLNKGFSRASGDIWCYLNADDVLFPGTLNKANNCFEKYPEKDVISAHGYVLDEEDNLLHRIFSHPFSLTAYAAWCCFMIQPSTFFKPVGGFNASNRICWDSELMVDYALAGANFKIVRDYWSGCRVYPDSITGSGKYRIELRKEHDRIRQKIVNNGYRPLPRSIEWLRVRAKDPVSTLYRLIDGIKHQDRKI